MAIKNRLSAMDGGKSILPILFLGGISFFIWIFYSYFVNGYFGFPLDDGWIHQTYARNLAEYGQWAYLPGTISGGSTSPLWTLLLSGFRGYHLGCIVGNGNCFLYFFIAFIFLVIEPEKKIYFCTWYSYWDHPMGETGWGYTSWAGFVCNLSPAEDFSRENDPAFEIVRRISLYFFPLSFV
jgi:hypothetical protein